MKKIYFTLCIIAFAFSARAQNQMCFAQVVCNSTQNLCFGDCKGTANCYPGGSGSYKFSWSNGATTQNISALCAGGYTVTVTDLNDGSTCTGQCTVTTPTQMNVSVIPSGNNASAVVSGGSPGYTYSWTPSGQTGANATGLSNGVHTVTVTDKNGCKQSAVVTITGTGIWSMDAAHSATVYPNPSTGVLNIELPLLSAAKLEVLNILGEQVYTEAWPAGKQKGMLDLTNLPAGAYIISIKHDEGVLSARIVKN